MELTVEERKRIYEEEKAKIVAEAARTGIPAYAGSKRPKFLRKSRPAWQLIVAVPAVLVGLAIIAAAIGSFVGGGNRGGDPPNRRPCPASLENTGRCLEARTRSRVQGFDNDLIS
jgi:hypothetical protein